MTDPQNRESVPVPRLPDPFRRPPKSTMRIRLGRILRVIADHVDQRSDAERREERRKAAQAVADAQRGLADALRHAERVGAVTRVEPRRHRSGMDK